MGKAGRPHPELACAGSVLGAVRDADVVLLLTEWREICDTHPEVLGKTVARRAIVDGRNALTRRGGRQRAGHIARPAGISENIRGASTYFMS